MLAPVIEFFDKLIDNFSWRRLVFVLLLFIMAAVALWTFESYTQSLKLARIAKQIDLLNELLGIAANVNLQPNSELEATFKALQHDLAKTARADSSTYMLPPWLRKALAASAAWVLLALFLLLSSRAGAKFSFGADAISGMIIVAVPFVWIATLLPDFSDEWINYVGYPVGHLIVVVVAILTWQGLASRRGRPDARIHRSGR